jgi:ribosomal protein S18 acetylase RimI-like enzyme
VIERDGLVLGYCITSADDFPLVKKTVSISELYIHPEMWRAGLGSMLLDLVLRSLISRGATTAILDVLEKNERGIAFYERQGFRHVEGADRMTNVDSRAFRVRQYRRAL